MTTPPAILVEIVRAAGSTPREEGAWMIVREDGAKRRIEGTIGGGELEWRAMQRADELLAEGGETLDLDLPLGPALAQCCGGHVGVRLRRMTPELEAEIAARAARAEAGRPHLHLYGAGHVGRAVIRAVAPLPFRITWTDCRRGIFRLSVADNVETRTVDDPREVAAAAAEGGFHLIMTHSHAMDLDIVESVLQRGDFAWCGLIGSLTKRRRFESRLRARGLDRARLERLVCPIGIAGIRGKAPEVIAASVAAQLLIAAEALAARGSVRSVA